MLIFIIAVAAVLLTILLGAIMAFAMMRVDTVVTETKIALENRDQGYNPALTLGHKIKVDADVPTQLQNARILAAKRAAALPRGANMRIGRLGYENLKTASEGLTHDPLTAVRIAAFHGWDGARSGAPAGGVPVAAPAAAAPAAAPAAAGEIELVPGRDYPYIEITDSMSPEEVRKARIANAKAKSQAMKAAKAAQTAGGAVPTAAPAAAPAVTPSATPAPAVPVGVAEPVYIEITDDMSPDEVRKARIENSKRKSAYNKALKAAGVDPQAVAAGQAAPPAAAPAPAATPSAAPAPAVPAGIEEPVYIEITDDMSPDEIRRARVENSKRKSAYNKALKAAGIDPSTVASGASAAQQQTPPAFEVSTEASPRAATPAEPVPTTHYEPVAVVPDSIPRPNYIEITDDMSPDEIRQARIHNSKERSAYNKALKAAGIDPKTVTE